MTSVGRVDFFISYNTRDEQWASWIAWVLEDAGYVILLQAWDFKAGGNFVLEMQAAAERADRTIAVFTPNYFESTFVKPEWAAAFSDDPDGVGRRLVPVRVTQCEIPGMLKAIIYIDLVGLDQKSAGDRLLANLRPGRSKPLEPPVFPGPQANESVSVEAVDEQPSLVWRPLDNVPTFSWRSELRRTGSSSAAAFEVQLIPVEPLRVEIRRLRSLADELVTEGRAAGLFETSEQVDMVATDRLAGALVERSRTYTASGLMVTRTGQRGVWIPLPRDNMGSVYDRDEIGPRLVAALKLLLSLQAPEPRYYAIAARIEPITMVQVGLASSVGSRNMAHLPFASRTVEAAMPDDMLDAAAAQRGVDQMAEEILARVEAKLQW